MNEDYKKAKSYQEKMGGTLHLAVEELATALGVAEKGVDEFGRLTEEGAKNFAELLGVAGKEQIKSQRDIQKQTDKIQADVQKAFAGFAKRIPVIGRDLEKGFEKMMKSMTMRMDQILTKTWGRLGAGMKGAMKVGAGGIVAAGALMLKQFSEIEKSSVELSKQTGLTGKNLKALRSSMVDAQNSGYKFGISMQESAEATAGMVKSLGDFRKVSSEMVKTASLLAKYAGVSAKEGAEFTGLMIKGFGKTAKQVMNFGNVMKDFATSSGVNARKVMADIMQNTNLTSIYMSKGVGYLKRAAVQAAKLNMSMQETASATEMFMDIDSSAEVIGKINQYMGSSLNSLELFNLSAKGDTEAIMKRLGKAFSSPRGIRMMEEMPGYANKLGKELGFSLKQMRIMAGLDKEQAKVRKVAATEQETIAEAVQSQQTTFSKISNTFKSMVFPQANSLAQTVLDITNLIGPTGIKIGIAAAAGTGLVMIAKMMKTSPGSHSGDPMYVVDVGSGGGGDGRVGGKKKGAFGKSYSRGRAGGMGRGASLMRGGKALMGSMKGMKIPKLPKMGMLMSALMFIPSLMDAWKSKDWKKIIPGLFNLGGSILGGMGGAALGALAGGVGAVPLGMAGSMAGGAVGDMLSGALGFGKAAKGAMVNKPTLFMAGEEGLPEMIVPTGRISRGMPINKGVADGLGGMGVPGFAGGRYGAVAGLSQQQRAAAAAAATESTKMGSMADPQTQRVRSIQYEQDVQKRKADQRASMRTIEEKSLAILEEERKIAMDVGGPIGNFANKLGLWEKAKEAAGKYAKKTADRFWENMRNNNGDVMGALKDTWGQTVGDLKNLQANLYGKLEQWGNQLMSAAANWGKQQVNKGIDYLRRQGGRVLNAGMERIGIRNRANKEQFKEGLGQLGSKVATSRTGQGVQNWAGRTKLGAQGSYSIASELGQYGGGSISQSANLSADAMGGGFINKTAGYVGATVGKIKASSKALDVGLSNIDPGTAMALARGDVGGAVRNAAAMQGLTRAGGLMKGGALGSVGSSLGAGAGALANRDIKGAGEMIGLDLGRKGIEKGVTGLASKLGAGKLAGSIGGGVAAGAVGAYAGLKAGDMKAASKGALSGAVGYALGAILPLPPPLNLMAGSFLAGPVTEGILKTGQELKKGAGNMGRGMGKIFSGDFKGGAGQILKGGGQMLLSGLKGTGALLKGLGGAVGMKFGVAGWSPAEARAKSISQMAMGMRGKKSLLTGGGTFTQKKWQEGMAAAVKLGNKGPDKTAMAGMMSDIVRAFDVSPDIAEMFIFAALGANMDKDTKIAIENEITKGWGRQVGKGGWQADYNAGKRDDSWKSFARMSSEGGGDASTRLTAAMQNSRLLDRATSAAQGGFTPDELKNLGIGATNSSLATTGTGYDQMGNVYVNGNMLGVVTSAAAEGDASAGLPVAVLSRIADKSPAG